MSPTGKPMFDDKITDRKNAIILDLDRFKWFPDQKFLLGKLSDFPELEEKGFGGALVRTCDNLVLHSKHTGSYVSFKYDGINTENSVNGQYDVVFRPLQELPTVTNLIVTNDLNGIK